MRNAKSEQFRESLNQGDWTYAMSIIIMILLPIHVQYLPPFMITWMLFWFIERHHNKKKLLNSGKLVLMLLVAFILFFSVMSISLTYSDNLKNGILLLFRRLSLLIFPLILFYPGEKIKIKIKNLLKVFTAGTSLYLIVCFVYAFVKSVHIQNGIFTFNSHPADFYWNNYFIGTDFSFSQHPSYLAMYVILSIFIALEFWFTKSQKLSSRILWLLISFFLLVSLYFISSRAGILSIMVLLPSYLIFKTRRIKYKGVLVLVFVILIPVLIAFFISNERIQNYLKDESGTPLTERLMADERMSIWKSAVGVIKDNPVFGVGIGDSCEELKREFKELGFVKGYYENLNAHNQYLEVLLGYGLIGFLIFIAILGLMAYIVIRNRNLLYGLFILMMLIFFMFESILNRIAGVSFFALFSFLLLHLNSATSISSDQKSTV